jgi:hypothetical protein
MVLGRQELANISVVRVDVHEEIVVVLVVGEGDVGCAVAALQRGFGQNLRIGKVPEHAVLALPEGTVQAAGKLLLEQHLPVVASSNCLELAPRG